MATAVVALAVVLTGWLFNTVMDGEWKTQRAAVFQAYEKTILTNALKVERFVGDKPYTVIQGEDKIGQRVLIWVAEDEMSMEMAANGITAEQAEQQTLAKHPDAKVLRVTPGKMGTTQVWEVFYKLKPEGADKEQYYYDYYGFKDGQPVDTWNLSIN